MRLVAINSTRIWGGAEAWFQTFCTGMAHRGHEITLVCHPDSELRRRLSNDSRVSVAPVAIRAELNYFRSLQLARVLRDARPDVLIAHRPKDIKLAVAANWVAGNAPIVHVKHYGEPLKSRFDYRFFWKRGVHTMVAVSQDTRNRLRNDAPWLGDMPVRVIHNAVDIERFRPAPGLRDSARAQFSIPKDSLVVSFHGRLAPPKRVDLAVRAIAMAAKVTAVHGLIIGEGPEGPALRKLAGALDAPVTFAGFRDDAPSLLAASDVEITMSEIEGVPLAVLEAMACGLPVIASNATSHPEVVEDGKTGKLVRPGVADGAAEAIVALSREPEERVALGAAARARTVEQFSVTRMLDLYEALLERIAQPATAQQGSDR
ncbi:MAG TPA: glycosyltransferase family 4 protein [Gemmatimonadota bacterium]|nr:glycosyltransferase family 4 protein [Gemmatimonadota bacterium]